MAHPHDQDDKLLVRDVIDDPVIANAQPVAVFVPGELLDVDVRAAWIVAERGMAIISATLKLTTNATRLTC